VRACVRACSQHAWSVGVAAGLLTLVYRRSFTDWPLYSGRRGPPMPVELATGGFESLSGISGEHKNVLDHPGMEPVL
jgi:hypothetical protein